MINLILRFFGKNMPNITQNKNKLILDADTHMQQGAGFFVNNKLKLMCGLHDIDPLKFDYSIESLSYIDDILYEIYLKFNDGPDNQKNVDFKSIGIVNPISLILSIAGYVGEVHRKNSIKNLLWITYDQAINIDSRLIGAVGGGRDDLNGFMIWDGDKSFNFPVSKVYKFLLNGKEDSLKFFVEMALLSEIK